MIKTLKQCISIFIFTIAITVIAQPFCQKENLFGETVFVSNHNLENGIIKTPSFWINNNTENIEISRDTIIWRSNKTTLKRIWKNTNPNLKIIPQKQTDYYFTGKNSFDKNYGFHEIYIKDLYPGIDLIYSIENQKLKYSLVIQKNGNLDNIELTYDGNLISNNTTNSISLTNGYEDWQEYGIVLKGNYTPNTQCSYLKINNTSFKFILDKEIKKPFIIDPFVVFTKVTRSKIPKAYQAFMPNYDVFDLEYDHKGNVYIYGGNGKLFNFDSAYKHPYDTSYGNSFKTAKYNANGKLLWVYYGLDSISKFSDNEEPSGISVNKFTQEVNLTNYYTYLNTKNKIITLDSAGKFNYFAISQKANGGVVGSFHCPSNMLDSLKMVVITYFLNSNIAMTGNIYNDSHIADFNFTKIIGDQNGIDASIRGSNSFILSAFSPNWRSPDLFVTKFDYKNRKIVWMDTIVNPDRFKIIANRVVKLRIKYFKYPFTFVDYMSANVLSSNDSLLVFFEGKYLKIYKTNDGKLITQLDSVNPSKNKSQGVAIDPCNNIFIAGDSSKIYCYHLKDTLLTLKKTLNIDNYNQRYLFDLEYNAQSNLIYVTGDSILAAIQSPFACKDSSMITVLDSVNNICYKPIVAGLKSKDAGSLYSFVWTDTTNHSVVKTVDKLGISNDTLTNPTEGHVYKLRIMKNKTNMGLFTDLYFNVLKSSKVTQTIHGCIGNAVKVARKTFTANATINDTLNNAIGCDSVITYKIVFHPTFKDTFHYKACIGDTLKFVNKFITSSGIYHDTFKSIWQCDSFVLRDVKFFGTTDTQTIHICRNTYFKVGKNIYSKAGFYSDTFQNTHSCDSIICTKLIVHHDTTYTVKHQICSTDSIKLAGKYRKIAGIYTDSFLGFWSCDSVIHHQLVVHKTSTDTVKFHLCKGQSVYINGNKYNSPGEFSSELKNQFGCDSLVHYVITQSNMIADFNIDTTDNPMLIFKNKSLGNTKFFWDFGDQTKDSTTKDPTHTYNNDQTHFVRICLSIVDSFGCNDTICQSVEISKLTYWIFNSFSPGSDGYNDIFKIGHKGGSFNYNLMVYNRWGALVYGTQNASIKDESKFWNGKVMNSGEDCPEGSYFVIYQLFVNGDNNPPKEIHGAVMLIK